MTEGITVAHSFSQEQENHQHDQCAGQQHGKLHVGDGGAYGDGAVGDDGDLQRRRQQVLQFGQQRANRVHHLDGVGAGLTLDVQHHRGAVVEPCRLLRVLNAVDRGADIAQQHRRAVAIGDHRVAIGGRGKKLVVGVDLERLRGAIQRTFRVIGGAGGNAAPHVVERHA